ncbi:transglutaminase TgpA family protein [Nostoc sp. DSM 114161]|uniref:transglutaminase TgpA family protein n=1 Tax=Nostoc sp. DSM 114161 TaxID=3440143 RepID=UPI0040456425
MFNLSRMNRFWRLSTGNFRQQNTQGSPSTEVENSISLRVLVLALVILGIVATDIAAETSFSLWALPLSVVGAVWSYYRRRDTNVAVKFCIAIGMLIALGTFFGRLVTELNDTRLGLAELLIQLQVLHSFDTPRRKNLGYSIVIGLILLGVAATLSQTLAFAPVLLLFLAIALPTLVLDYRSRLGLQPLKIQKEKTPKDKFSSLNFKFLIVNFFVIVGLGLAIFAVLPRLPGYQLRSFPVSSPIEIKGSFTGRSIINPGYVRGGNGNDRGDGTGQGKTGEPGKVDNNFYYGFNSEINQNLRGEMKPKVVMRVRSQAEGFWRVLAFDRYTGKGWEVSRKDDVTTIRRPPWSYQIFIPPPLISGKTQEVVQTYTVVSDLPNLIPAMANPKEIYFPTPMIAVDKENGLRSPVELSEGVTYTVVSEVPRRDRTLLGQTSTKYPRDIKDHYLQIPPEIAEKVQQRTEEILTKYNQNRVGKSSKNLDSAYEKALYLAQYLKQYYSIPQNALEFPYLDEKEDLVEAFLFKYKGGYPDHFSTVLTVMLRSIGIPARLVAGFSPGEFNPFTGMYVVRNTDAYAMTEVYFPKFGWFAFDPIPNHPLIPPSIEDTETFSVLRQFWQWVAGWLPSPVTGLLNNVFGTIFSWIGKAIAWFLALFTQGWLGVLTGLILGTTIAFFGWVAWGQWREWRNRRWLKKLPAMESLYQQMLQWTAQKGLGKHPAQTPLEYAKVSYQHHAPATAEIIDEICQAYVSWRYGGQNPNLNGLRQRWYELKKGTGDRAN